MCIRDRHLPLAAHLSGDAGRGAAGGAPRPLERALRDRAVPAGRGVRSRAGILRARLRRSRDAPPGGAAAGAAPVAGADSHRRQGGTSMNTFTRIASVAGLAAVLAAGTT